MFTYSEAVVSATQEQVLAAFSGEQAAVMQAADYQSRITPEFLKQFNDFVQGAPNPECERHGAKDIAAHFSMLLGHINSDKNPVFDYQEEIMAAIMVYNRHIIGTNRDRKLLARFKYDPKTKECYLPAEPAACAFNYYNSLKKPPLLKDIPNPIDLAFEMEEAHGYQEMSDRTPMRQKDDTPWQNLLYREPADCGQIPLMVIKDPKGVNTVIVPQRDIGEVN